MNCRTLQDKIDGLRDGGPEQLDLHEQFHLEGCNACQNYYADASKTRQLLRDIRQWEPVLDEPEELTRSIMDSIAGATQKPSPFTIRLRLVNRVLSAAVVALLLTLGIEQFVVLRKIHLLETKLGRVQQSYHHKEYQINKATIINIEKLFKDDPHGFKLEKLSTMFRFRHMKYSGFTFYDFNRYIKKDNYLSPALTEGAN